MNLKEDNLITVYIADVSPLDDDGLFERVYSQASSERRQKVDKLRARRDKNLSLGVEYLKLLAFIGRGSDCYGAYFNLSHSGDIAICAVADCPVGCDVQLMKDSGRCADGSASGSASFESIAERFFSGDEYKLISEQKDVSGKEELFYRIWALKESFMKCTGLGFELPMNEFSVLPDGGEIALRQSVDGFEYSFYEHAENGKSGNYRFACCVRGAGGGKAFWKSVIIK